MGQHTWFLKNKELYLKQNELYEKLDKYYMEGIDDLNKEVNAYSHETL